MILAVYGSVLSLGLLLAIARRRTLLVRGQGFFTLSGISAIVALGSWTIRGGGIDTWLSVVWLAVLAAALAARPRWFFLWHDPEVFANVVEGSLRMLLISFIKTEAGYDLKLRDGNVYLELRAGPCRTAVLRFRQSQENRKGDLMRSLLRKRFDPLFPRLKIHIR
ncbi:MAG: hypothetical protein LAQ69_14870 [Acidobacteriia bacterium]|nr:hypothetical protein [Terriglobia bacterium]